jgi:hypothetical protein
MGLGDGVPYGSADLECNMVGFVGLQNGFIRLMAQQTLKRNYQNMKSVISLLKSRPRPMVSEQFFTVSWSPTASSYKFNAFPHF